MLAGLLITMGALGDRIGRRRLLLIGAAAFGAASLLAAYADSAATLIAARAVLGVGGATLMPSTLALMRNMFHDAKQRGTAIGIWTATLTGGIALGPVLSGILLEHFWWGSVFLINIPAMLLLLLLAPLLVPEFRNPATGRFDLLSAALSLGALLPVIYGIKEMARDGVSPVAGAGHRRRSAGGRRSSCTGSGPGRTRWSTSRCSAAAASPGRSRSTCWRCSPSSASPSSPPSTSSWCSA